MTLAFWEPFRELDQFDRVVGDLFRSDGVARAQASRTHRLAADLAADKDGYIFRFDLPGVPKDSITIGVEDHVLTVSAERSETFGGDESKTVYRREVLSGKHERSFRLPEDAAADKVTASYNDGVLEVRIARAEAAQPRRIPITVS